MKVLRWTLCLGALIATTLTGLYGAGTAEGAYGFRQVGTPNIFRYLATAHLLESGKVLIFDGISKNAARAPLVEVYDPATETFSIVGSTLDVRGGSASAPLADGRLLVAGGASTEEGLSSAEIYDPATESFSPTGSMSDDRSWSTATRLNDGRVLITGGVSQWDEWVGFWNGILPSEIYDPATGTFTVTDSLSHYRVEHTATLLLDGRVLIAGGADGPFPYDDAEIYNPANGKFNATGAMRFPRQNHSATRLADGRVLITGGQTSGGTPIKTAEIFDPATGAFSVIGSAAIARGEEQATLMSDGRVILSGTAQPPFTPDEYEFATEIFDPATGRFTRTWSMVLPRGLHNAVALKDDTVLIVDGNTSALGDALPAEILTPPPPPVNGESVNVRPLAGEVAIKCAGDSNFKEIRDKDQIKVGCLVDSQQGTVGLLAAKSKTGNQSADFRGGVFKVTQKKGQDETNLTLTGPLKCGASSKRSLVKAGYGSDASASAGKSRKLWGKGKGRFKTKGKKGSATVRGTEWLVEDRCNGTTLFKVKSGVVMVRDDVKRKTIKLKAGKSYVAGKKAKKKKKKKRR